MQAITAENAVMMSSPEAARSIVIAITEPPQISMNASTAKMMLFSTLCPESFTGRYARGWMMDINSRSAWQRVENNIIFRSEEHTSELQSQSNLVCRLL